MSRLAHFSKEPGLKMMQPYKRAAMKQPMKLQEIGREQQEDRAVGSGSQKKKEKKKKCQTVSPSLIHIFQIFLPTATTSPSSLLFEGMLS